MILFHKIVTTFFIFIIYSQTSTAQISIDSLKQICTSEFESTTTRISNFDRVIVNEVFENYLDSTRIFIVTGIYPLYFQNKPIHSNHGGSTTRIYCLNPFTGSSYNFNTLSDFNQTFSITKKNICNLDKCFLYFDLVLRQTNTLIYSPRHYRQLLNKNSIYLNELLYMFSDIFPTDQRMTDFIEADISTSNNNNIKTYIKQNDTIYRYQFQFRKSSIETVSRTIINR